MVVFEGAVSIGVVPYEKHNILTKVAPILRGASVAPGVGILLTFLVVMPLSIAIVYLMQRIPILKYLVP